MLEGRTIASWTRAQGPRSRFDHQPLVPGAVLNGPVSLSGLLQPSPHPCGARARGRNPAAAALGHNAVVIGQLAGASER
jgi:hypothetical protein